MVGIPGRSGPPGNSNANGNSGGKRGRSGSPRNTNRLRHGVYSFLARGKLPFGCSPEGRSLAEFRDELRRAVTDLHGDCLGIHDAMVDDAFRNEGRALLLLRWLGHAKLANAGGLSTRELLRALEAIGRAMEGRDKAVRSLLRG